MALSCFRIGGNYANLLMSSLLTSVGAESAVTVTFGFAEADVGGVACLAWNSI